MTNSQIDFTNPDVIAELERRAYAENAKHKITQWRKQAHILGVLFGVALWAVLAVGWPMILVAWLVFNR